MSSKIGRPKKEYPEHEIQSIIYRFAKEVKTSGELKYMEVYRFANELFEKGEINYRISEFYWRKGSGRELIDKANELLFPDIRNSSEDDIIINTNNTVNRYFNGKKSDKEKLIGTLQLNERKLEKYLTKSKKLDKEIIELKEIINNQKDTIASLERKVNIYEERFFQWLELSINKNVPLYNIGTTGKSRSWVTNDLMNTIFSDKPIELFREIEKIKLIEDDKKETKTIQLNNYKENKKSVLDDINF